MDREAAVVAVGEAGCGEGEGWLGHIKNKENLSVVMQKLHCAATSQVLCSDCIYICLERSKSFMLNYFAVPHLSCCMPTHQLESSCLAGDPCAADTSGTPSGPLSSPRWAGPPDPLQALHPALPQAASGAVEGHAEGPGDKQNGMIFMFVTYIKYIHRSNINEETIHMNNIQL